MERFINLCRKNAPITPLKQFSCCDTVKTLSKKDLLVKNPHKVHFAKKIIVGKEFRKLLKALYQDHPKAAQAKDGKFELPKSKKEGGDDKVSTYNMESRTDAAKNKTITELRSAILKLLEKLKKKAQGNSSQGTEQRDGKQDLEHKLPERKKFSETAKTKVQGSSGDSSEITLKPSSADDGISAKRANHLDLLNFISRMKSMEGVQDVDLLDRRHGMYNMNGMDVGDMANARHMLSPSFSSPMAEMNDQGQNGFLPGNGLQMQEMNLAEQRKRIEDQMENHLAQLQTKIKLLEQQQEGDSMQNLLTDHISNVAQGLQYPIATPPIPFGFSGHPVLNQAQLLHQANPYLSMNMPPPRFRTWLPPMNPRFRYPLNNEDASEDDDEDDYDGDQEEPPPHYPAPDDEDADNEEDEEGRYGPEND